MKIRLLALMAVLLGCCVGCAKHDDFEFKGLVINYEICTSYQDLGYLVALDYPEGVGGDYKVKENGEYVTYHNVVVIYQADRLLTDRSVISGTIYWEDHYAKSYCSRTYTDRDVPEAVFTSLKTVKGSSKNATFIERP